MACLPSLLADTSEGVDAIQTNALPAVDIRAVVDVDLALVTIEARRAIARSGAKSVLTGRAVQAVRRTGHETVVFVDLAHFTSVPEVR